MPQANEKQPQQTPSIHRSLVGDPAWYDIQSAVQFNLLTTLGLREHHKLLDIGCGSLRSGRLFLAYLLPGGYFGLELQEWLVQKGIQEEVGESVVDLKRPTFSHDPEFTLSTFGCEFDFLLAHSIFSHTPEHEIRRCMAEAAKVMKPSSIFAATYWEGPHNSTDKSWMIRAEFRPEFMRAIVEEAGLVFHPITWAQHDLQSWFLVLHKDNEFEFADPNDFARVQQLEDQLALTAKQLNSIRSHPWVRLGHKIRYALVWLKLLKNLGSFRNRSVFKYLGMRYKLSHDRLVGWFGSRPRD